MPSDTMMPARIDYDELELDDQLASLDGVPYTGIVYSRRGDGSIESEGAYRDGLPDGIQEERYPDGSIERRWIAVRGQGSREAWSWYRNGQMRSHRRNGDGGPAEVRAWDQEGNPIDPAQLTD